MNEVPPVMSAASNTQAQVVPKTSLAAIWSLVFGVSSFCLSIFGFIPALILGIIALVKINGSQGQLKGNGLAIAGMLTGGMGIFVAAILAAIAFPAFNGVVQKAKIVKQENDVRILLVACQMHAADNEGKFPANLQDLYPDYIDDQSILEFLNNETHVMEPYMYFSGKTMESEARSLLIASPVVQRQRRVVGFCEGSVEQIMEEEFYRLAELESGGQ